MKLEPLHVNGVCETESFTASIEGVSRSTGGGGGGGGGRREIFVATSFDTSLIQWEEGLEPHPLPICLAFIGTILRYCLQGSCIADCCTICWCFLCTLCQEAQVKAVHGNKRGG